MLIIKSIKKFIVFKEDTVLEALRKIEENVHGVVFVLDYSGVLEGIATDGDIRRWLTLNKNFKISDPISDVMNKKFVAHLVDDEPLVISDTFSGHIKVIPLLNKSGRLISIATSKYIGMQIGKFVISDQSPCFIIAEIGNNHNGDIKLAKKLVNLAIEAGADCVKFQMRNLEKLYKNNGSPNDKSADLGTQYTLDLLSRFQLSNNELLEIFDYCKSKDQVPLCTPWDLDSLEVLENYGMEAYKVSSADLTNTELLEALVKTGKPLICSTGMSKESEIKRAVSFLQSQSAQYVLLHCNSTYPTPNSDVNLRYLPRLQALASVPVGYSGHERGFIAPLIAVGLGAKVIEKHFTIDKEMEGNDHKVSLLPSEFREMVDQIRLTEEFMGDGGERSISQGESMNREILAKSLIINQNLSKGMMITRDMVEVKSPGQGLQPYYLPKLLGTKANRDFEKGDFFFESDINETTIQPRNYLFQRPFGIPVRYHDYQKLISQTNVDFIEFHLSYKDLEENIVELFDKKYEIGFAIHCPELFSGDHILNLCSENKQYREHSIAELQKVVDVTQTLKNYFPNEDRPKIVINVGGFSKSSFLSKSKVLKMYDKVAEALDRIDSNGIELIIQTMPPFPWHFGGQSYHNLFINPDEIAQFCIKNGYRICLDVSHSQMACNYYNWSLKDFISKIWKYCAYLHIVDAVNVDGEGVQIGEGDVDFVQLSESLNSLMPNTKFIPEIWQGHKQNGTGFWKALEFLEGKI